MARRKQSPATTIQARSLVRALEGLERFGANSDQVLASCGLRDPREGNPDARIPFTAFAAFYNAAAEATGRDDFGLRVGAETHLGTFDVLGYAALSCPDVRTALHTLRKYFPVLEEGGIVDLSEESGLAVLEYSVNAGPHDTRQVVELGLAVLLRWLQSVLNDGWLPDKVCFTHAEPADSAPHKRLFGAPVAFACASNAIIFPSECLGVAVASADPALQDILERQLCEALQGLPRITGWRDRVRNAVVDRQSRDGAGIAAISASLAVSPRTLQRRLLDEGTTFRRVVDEARRDLALRYLKDQHVSIANVALTLGYSDISAFYRAFKRWTGLTPDVYRHQRDAPELA